MTHARTKKKLILAVAGCNLAETGRMLEIARAARDDFDILFASYGGQFERLIEDEGFELRRMTPRLTARKLEDMRVVLSGETWNTVGYFSHRELEPRVESEIALFEETVPAAVLTGWCLSVPVSARAAGVPFVNVLHSTSIREYYEAGLQTWPDRLDYEWLKWLLGEARLNARMNRRVLSARFVVRPYNRVARRHRLEPFQNFIDLIEGDWTLLADIPEWVGLESIRPNKLHVGPLPARIPGEIPRAVAEIPRDRPIVYFGMGSSGKPELVGRILEGFEGKPYRVIAPVGAHIEGMHLDVPDNVVVTGFLPAHKVNPMADVSVIHGGQNTVMQACLARTPIVGAGMHPEQEANLEACVRKGFAIRLNKWRLSADDVVEAVDTMLRDEEAKRKVEAFADQLERWDGPANAARFLRETFGSEPGTRPGAATETVARTKAPAGA